jgi:O-antigen ligase
VTKKNNKFQLLIYATLSSFNINLGGQLGLNTVFALVYSLSFKDWKRLYIEIPDVKKINIAYGLFFVGQVVSDIINHSDSSDYIRGWANILMAIVILNFITRRLQDAPIALIYFFIGDIIQLTFFKSQKLAYSLAAFGEDMGIFKFWIAPILNDLILLSCWYFLNKRKVSKGTIGLIFIIYGLFCFALDYRSNGLFFILTSLIYVNISLISGISFKKLVPYLLVFLVAFEILYVVYVNEVQKGNIGGVHAQEQLKRIDNPYNPFYLLLTGRSETFVAFAAIVEQPIFGHGSWAPDRTGLYTLMAYKLHDEEDKYEARMETLETKLIIPSHSVVMGAWLTAGIAGFVAIMYILVLFLRRGLSLIRDKRVQNSAYIHIIIFFILNGTWTFLFSPLPQIKDALPPMIAFILVCYQIMSKRIKVTYTS